MLSEKLDGEITFEKIHLKPFTTLVVKNAAIVDRNPVQDPLDSTSIKIDTLFRAEYIIARFTLDGLFRQESLHIDKAYVSNAQMTLVIEDKEDTGDGDVTTDNLSRIFRIRPSDSEPSEKELFHIRKVEIRKMGFAMKIYQSDRPSYEGGIDWNDLDVKDINLNARNLRFENGIMYGIGDRLSFREKSGYQVVDMSGDVRVGRGKTIVENLHIDDLWSDVQLPLFMMSYANVDAFSEFISQVKLDGDISPSILDFETLSYFAPALKGNRFKARVTGGMSGYVDDFTVKDVSIDTGTGRFSGTVNGRISGLPDIDRTYIDAELSDFLISTRGLGDFVSEWMTDGNMDIDRFAKGILFSVNAKGKGLIDDLYLQAGISSLIGGLDADIRLKDVTKPARPIGIEGNLQTKDLNLGQILGTEFLGPATLRTSLKTQIGTGDTASEAIIDTLIIDRLNANHYDFSNIFAVGNISSDNFNGRIVSHDPNLNFIFQGTFALSSKTQNARYRFFTNIGHADLNAIHIDKRGISKINMTASADFTKTGNGDLKGNVDIADLMLENNMGRHDIGGISLHSFSTGNSYEINMDSNFAIGRYTGTAPISTFISDLRNITLKKELPSMFSDSSYVWNGNSYDLDFHIGKSMDLLTFVMPGLYIEEGSSILARLSTNGNFLAQMTSERLAYKKNYLKGLKATFSNAGDELEGILECDEIKAATITLSDNNLNILVNNDHIGMKLAYDNHSEAVNKGEFIIHGDLSRDGEESRKLSLAVLPSSIYVNSKEWRFLPSHIDIDGNGIDINAFTVASGEERIRIDGRMSQTQKDTLTLSLDRFDISIADTLLGDKLGLRGAATGNLKLTSPLTDKGILVDLICDSTYISNVPAGVISAGSKWDESERKFHIHAHNEINGRKSFNVEGSLDPKGSILDLTASLDSLDIAYVQPMLTDVFSRMNGFISGQIRAEGPLSMLNLSSTGTTLDNAMLKVAYTCVPYFAEGPFHIDNSGVWFDNIDIKDRYQGTGVITGKIGWNHLKDIRFDTNIRVNDIEAIDIDEKNGMEFYGNIFGTGNVSITGPMNSLLLTVDAITERQGQLHIPLTTSATAGKVTNLLRFKEDKAVERVDPYEIMIDRLNVKQKSDNDFTVRLKVNAQPEVRAFVEIDKASGNVLSGYGSGLIDLEVSNDVFNINGDYTLSGGSYKFVAMNLVSRDFSIQDGSSVRFNGDIMDSSLDINATYSTKASLSTLLADSTSVVNKRIVNCGIAISGPLSNPRLGFSIEIPDLDPMVKSRVESALSTEDKVQKQFLSLIVSNNFLPDEQSGIVNNTSLLYSNVTEILANQMNRIFQKLDIPLDLGLNYQPNERGNDIFDVAVSTQMFNNRVVVNGNIGNKQYMTGNTQTNVVGDIDIEWKLGRMGALRLIFFSHSADQFSNFLDNSQRNGAGIMYQTEFNSFGKMLKNLFSRKSKRKEARMLEGQAMLEEGRVELNIEAPAPNDKTDNDRKQR